jgi:hypothetical protein
MPAIPASVIEDAVRNLVSEPIRPPKLNQWKNNYINLWEFEALSRISPIGSGWHLFAFDDAIEGRHFP